MSDYAADIAKYTSNVNLAAVDAIVKYCGIALRNRDSSLVSASDPDELGRVRDGFAAKKLGLAADAAVEAETARRAEAVSAHPDEAVRLVQPGLPLNEFDLPIPPVGEGDVLVRVRAAGICHSDAHYRAGRSPVHPLPLTLGHEVAGVVEEVGTEVARFTAGDRVAAAEKGAADTAVPAVEDGLTIVAQQFSACVGDHGSNPSV